MDDNKMQETMEQSLKKRSQKTFEKTKICPFCGNNMKYIYGEMYECPGCGRKELTDFGKVRRFLDTNGPQPAIVISDATGVSLEVIDGFLKQGRVEIPDGSEVYIKCQKCGTDIRYGRYCPECMMQMTKNIGQALWSPEMGEKPQNKPDMSGRMHTLDRDRRRFKEGKSDKDSKLKR